MLESERRSQRTLRWLMALSIAAMMVWFLNILTEERRPGPLTPASSEKSLTLAGEAFAFKPFVVSLSDQEGKIKFFRLVIELEVYPKGSLEIRDRLPVLRDAVLERLNSRQASDLQSAAARQKLEQELKAGLNLKLADSFINKVTFRQVTVR